MTDTPDNFLLCIENGVAIVALDRPERKNPLTFENYAELHNWFCALVYRNDIRAVVFNSNSGNFSSGGGVHDIIGPITRITGNLVKTVVNCGKPVIATIDRIYDEARAIITTDQVQVVTDKAVPLFVGDGMRTGMVAKRLHHEIRALHIYKGVSDVQKLIITQQTMKEI